MDLYDRISALARNKGTTLSAIEKELNLGACTISKWKKSDPSSHKLYAVASFLGVTVDYLLTGDECIGGHADNTGYYYFYCDENNTYDERWVMSMWRAANNDEKADLIYFLKKVEERLKKESKTEEAASSRSAV